MYGNKDKILGEVFIERERQDRIHGGPQHDDLHTPDEWIEMTRSLLNESTLWVGKDMRAYRAKMLQIAAICVAAIESHDRTTS